MIPCYQYRHRVREEEIDVLGHASNIAYVRWLQDAAVAHAAANGWPKERHLALGCGWVVRSHQVEYLAPAFAGEALVIRTWVETMNSATSLRRYQVIRESDGRTLATASTLWAFVRYETGMPRRIPAEVAEAFPLLPAGP